MPFFPRLSKLDFNSVTEIPPALWMSAEVLLGDWLLSQREKRASQVKGLKPCPSVVAADISPLLTLDNEAQVADWIPNPFTNTLLELARPAIWERKGYPEKKGVLQRFRLQGSTKKIPAQTAKGYVYELPQLESLRDSFFLRFDPEAHPACCRLWTTDERYRHYRDQRSSVRDALKQAPTGTVYPLVHPKIVEEKKQDDGKETTIWYRTFRLFFVLNDTTRHYDCVGGVTVDERGWRDPAPRLSFAVVASEPGA